MSTGSTQSQAILELLQKDSIVPDVVPSAPDLQGELIIAYPTHTISSGEYVERIVAKDTPIVGFKPFQGSSLNPSDGKYSILMIDPDLTHPNDRLSGQVRHWLQPGLVFSDGGSAEEGWIARTTESTVTEYLECAPGPPGHAHRYVFLLLRESPSSAPQATDFPSTQLTAAPSHPKTNENLADRMGFNASEYAEKKGLQVVGVTWMFVRPDAESLVDNMKVGAQTVLDKVRGL